MAVQNVPFGSYGVCLGGPISPFPLSPVRVSVPSGQLYAAGDIPSSDHHTGSNMSCLRVSYDVPRWPDVAGHVGSAFFGSRR